MSIRIKTIIIELGVIFLILYTLGVAAALVPLSQQTVASNPELAHMRVPVLIIVWAMLACAIAALVLGLLLLEKIRNDRVFEAKPVEYLNGMGICALAAILPVIILIFYTQVNITGSITNLYAGLGVFVLLFAATFFFLVAALFEKAVTYKQENELTI